MKFTSVFKQAIDSAEATAIDDVEDDLSRELAFYNQVRCQAGHATAGAS